MRLIVGGGAAGIFAALWAKESAPQTEVVVLEKKQKPLAKVALTGGGRCNLSHAAFDPKALCQKYPRGEKELLGPFTRFGPRELVEWFSSRGIELKTEKDGRIFPVSNRSQTIIDALLQEAEKLGVQIVTGCDLQREVMRTENGFLLRESGGKEWRGRALLLATGSSPDGYLMAQSLGHTVVPPIPSLFTLHVPTSELLDLSGASVDEVELSIPGTAFKQQGPLLITHFGFSGPATLALSSWAAPLFFEKGYHLPLAVNWLPSISRQALTEELLSFRASRPQQSMSAFLLPKKLWQRFLLLLGIKAEKRWGELSNKEIQTLCEKLQNDLYQVEGKSVFKEEFVTCGGVERKEINWKTMESRLVPRLFFAGEIIDIDAVTGGFNLQAAWTTGYLAGLTVAGS